MKSMKRFFMIVGSIGLLAAMPLKAFSIPLSLSCNDVRTFAYSTLSIQPAAEGVYVVKASGQNIQLLARELGIKSKKNKLNIWNSLELFLDMSDLSVAPDKPLLVMSRLSNDVDVTFEGLDGERVTQPMSVNLDTALVKAISVFDLNVTNTVEGRLSITKKNRHASTILSFDPQECKVKN